MNEPEKWITNYKDHTHRAEVPDGGHDNSICTTCGKKMSFCWDTVCYGCGDTSCYECSKSDDNHWWCPKCFNGETNMKDEKYLMVYANGGHDVCPCRWVDKKPSPMEIAKAELVVHIPTGTCIKNRDGRIYRENE